MKVKSLALAGAAVLQVGILVAAITTLRQITQASESPRESDLQDNEFVFERPLQIPFPHFVTGMGRIIPSSDYVHVNAPFSGIVKNVFVKEGGSVEKGGLLFQLDDTALSHALEEKKAEYETALAKAKCLDQGPSIHELEAKAKEIEEKEVHYKQKLKESQMFTSLFIEKAVSEREKEEKDSLLQIARIEKERVIAEYESLKKGRAKEEKEIGYALVAEKKTRLKTTEKMINDCKVTSPISGKVVSVEIHSGEYIDPNSKVAITLGSDTPLHLEVSIDEKDAWRITPTKGLKAIAVHQSNQKMHFILDYVGLKPCLQENEKAKRKLTLLFAFDKGKAPIYFEQNLDVYIEAASVTDTAYLDYQFKQLR